MALLSGQITVTTAGTSVAGPSTPAAEFARFAIKAHPDNTDTVWVGNNGSDVVSNSTGFALNVGEGIVVDIANLSLLRFDADVSGNKFCWFRLK
jgi:hypothetical protein